MNRSFTFLLLLAVFSLSLYGQEIRKPILADRPDFTNSPNVLPLNTVQIESGIYFNREKFEIADIANEISNIGIFSTLVRVSISEMFEFRAGGEYLMRTEKIGENESTAKGLNSLYVGTKFQFLSSGKIPLNAAIILEVGLPFGASEFKPEKAEPRIYLSVAHDIAEPVSVTYNFGTQYQSSESNYLNFYSLSFGISISDRVGAIAEYYGFAGKTITPKHFVNAGLTYLQSSNLVVDLLFGKEITPDSDSWSMTAGFSVRLPD
jgi:hypothetical protein